MALHPATVHFPIALLITAGITWLIYFAYPKKIFRDVAFWMHTFGLIGVGLAILTGNLALPVDIGKTGQNLLNTHETLGYATGWIFLLLWLWHYFRKRTMAKGEIGIFATVYILSLSFVIWTAFIGGKLVFEFGAGIDQ